MTNRVQQSLVDDWLTARSQERGRRGSMQAGCFMAANCTARRCPGGEKQNMDKTWTRNMQDVVNDQQDA